MTSKDSAERRTVSTAIAALSALAVGLGIAAVVHHQSKPVHAPPEWQETRAELEEKENFDPGSLQLVSEEDGFIVWKATRGNEEFSCVLLTLAEEEGGNTHDGNRSCVRITAKSDRAANTDNLKSSSGAASIVLPGDGESPGSEIVAELLRDIDGDFEIVTRVSSSSELSLEEVREMIYGPGGYEVAELLREQIDLEGPYRFERLAEDGAVSVWALNSNMMSGAEGQLCVALYDSAKTENPLETACVATSESAEPLSVSLSRKDDDTGQETRYLVEDTSRRVPNTAAPGNSVLTIERRPDAGQESGQ